MRTVKLDELSKFAKVDIGNHKSLTCLEVADQGYSLLYKDYSGSYVSENWIAEDKKRLSTINKYAEKYGVRFEV